MRRLLVDARAGPRARPPGPGRVALRARDRRAAAAHVRRPALRRARPRPGANRDGLRRRLPPRRRAALPRQLARRGRARRRPAAGGVLVQPATRPALEAPLVPHLSALLPAVPGALSAGPRVQPLERGQPLVAADLPPPAEGGRLLQRDAARLPDAARSPRATCSTGATSTAGCGATAPRCAAARGCGRCTTTWTSTARGRGGGRSRAGSCASPTAGSGSPRRPASCARAATRATTRSARPARRAGCSPSRAAPRASSASTPTSGRPAATRARWDSGWFRSDGEARPAYRVIVRALARERKLDRSRDRGPRPPAHARHAHLVHAHRSSGSTLRATMGFISAPGPLEMMVILVVALLVLGPQRLPEVGALGRQGHARAQGLAAGNRRRRPRRRSLRGGRARGRARRRRAPQGAPGHLAVTRTTPSSRTPSASSCSTVFE